MAETISVRFDLRTREVLEREAARLGVGISTFVRQLAESELKRVQRASMAPKPKLSVTTSKLIQQLLTTTIQTSGFCHLTQSSCTHARTSSAILAGDIVLVDWRDKHFPSEPGRTRPAIIVVADHILIPSVRFLTVVPLTGDANLAPPSVVVNTM